MLAPQIAAHNFQLSPETTADIEQRVARLHRFYERMMSCRVSVDVPQRRRLSDTDQYRVRLDIGLPGGEIAINHQPRHELRTALDEAFATARRRVEDYARHQRGSIHPRASQPVGRVSQYYPLGGYGFIEATDGHEIYFDKRSVLGGAFDRLDVGTRVRFTEEAGDKGPQASTVAVAAAGKSASKTA
jgi:cold shock CspA family protein/ribosome-associated translation inhibitor RaiA